jgi:predicted CXXCH cytochrome family protein
MKNITKIAHKSNYLKNIFTIMSGICIYMSASPIVGTVYAEKNEMCLFSKQLESSPMREQYIASVASEGSRLLAYNTITDNQVQSDASDDESFRNLFLGGGKSSLNQGDTTLDSFSRDCLSCHDGGHASDIAINYRNTPGNKRKTYDGTKEHPIGMDYAAYAAMDHTGYKPAFAFNSKMVFVNGRVGCLTCHNPLNPEKSHLVMSDNKSALCLTCHNK